MMVRIESAVIPRSTAYGQVLNQLLFTARTSSEVIQSKPRAICWSKIGPHWSSRSATPGGQPTPGGHWLPQG